jgi:hypothetical protein
LTIRACVKDSYNMTLNAHALIALEASGTAGMMMPSSAVMCCRMCA